MIAFLVLSALGQGVAGADSTLVLANIAVVDVRTGSTRPGMIVTIKGGRIATIAPASRGPDAVGRRINGSGKFLIPGLWDMHVHLAFGDWFPGARDIALPLFVANGVTGVRDMGSDLAPVFEWRKSIGAGTLIGPRIVTSGPMLDGPKPRFPSSVAIATPADGRRAVRDLQKQGADFIKLQSLIPREAVFAIADEAKKRRISVAGHVPDAVRASEASSGELPSKIPIRCSKLFCPAAETSLARTASGTWPATSIRRFLASSRMARTASRGMSDWSLMKSAPWF